ncbi:MAG: M81 family metallopeptidase [Gammaproteobacteria bacterium]|nr:M81 family metallopeptidase [Gammaproteobacteria bacterium]
MKCVIAMMQHETNTFSPLSTPLAAFGSGTGQESPPSGEQAISIYAATDFAFAGMLDVARSRGMDCVVPVAAYAEPSGKVDDAAFDYICDQICDAVKQGCDAVLLDLHGAMVTQSHDDGEGELLRRIREVAAEVPIAVALDFHTNMTASMVDNCNVIDGYRTYPHIDMYDTGKRAAKTLFHCLDHDIETKMRWRALPMMTHMIKQTPLRQPMKDIMDLAIEAVDNTDILNASIFGGFPLADIPHVSLSVLTVEPSRNYLGEGLIKQLCAMAWMRRHDFIFKPEPMVESINKARLLDSFPVVIADHGDNSGAGGSTDDLSVLDEMLKQELTSIIAGPIWDPLAVGQMIACGEGNEITLRIGGNTSVPSIGQVGHGISCTGKVKKITDGRFVITGPMQTGLEVCLGRSVVFDIGAAQIVVCEERWEPFDPGCFTHAGLDPTGARYILIKSRQHFRAGFEPIASHIVLAAGPGVCSSDYAQFDYQHLLKPIFPLNLEMVLQDQ